MLLGLAFRTTTLSWKKNPLRCYCHFSPILFIDTHRWLVLLLFLICAFAYRKSNCSLVPYLVAFTIHPGFWSVSVPHWDSYDLSHGGVATARQIESCLTASVRRLKHTPSHKLQPLAGESPAQLQLRKHSDYDLRRGQSLQSIVDKLIKQCPCQSPSIPPSTDYHDMLASSRTMQDLFQSWFSNDSLNRYLAFVQRTFDSVCSRAVKQHSISSIPFALCFVFTVHNSAAATLSRIMCSRQAPSLGSTPVHFPEVPYETMKNHKQSDRLSSMLDGLNLGDHLSECHKAVMACETPEGRKHCDLFKELPNRHNYPDYYNIISQPIAMSVICKRANGTYYKNVKQYFDDWKLMFNNARTYNRVDSWVYIDANEMEKVFMATFDGVTVGLPGASPSEGGSMDSALTPMENDERLPLPSSSRNRRKQIISDEEYLTPSDED